MFCKVKKKKLNRLPGLQDGSAVAANWFACSRRRGFFFFWRSIYIQSRWGNNLSVDGVKSPSDNHISCTLAAPEDFLLLHKSHNNKKRINGGLACQLFRFNWKFKTWTAEILLTSTKRKNAVWNPTGCQRIPTNSSCFTMKDALELRFLLVCLSNIPFHFSHQ